MNEKIKIIENDNKTNANSPLVSVIIPIYNAEKYLKITLISVLQQKYKNIEIICVNDGSTDMSLKILEKIAKTDNRIKIINQENAGPAKSRNVALDYAKGKYVSFVDSDDKIDPYMYEILVDYAETQNADIVVFGGIPFPNVADAPKWIRTKLSPKAIVYEGTQAGVDALFNEESSKPFMWLHFIRRDLLESAPKLRMTEQLELGEDQVFQFSYFPRAKKVVFIEDKLYFYRWSHEGSLMWKYNKMKTQKFKKHLKIVEKVFEDWNKNQYNDPYDNLVSWMVGFLYVDLKSFPVFQQYEFAKEIMQLSNKYGHSIYMCSEDLLDAAKDIEQLSLHETNGENDIDIINEEIAQYQKELDLIENEIIATLNSGAFKIGRLLTPQRERIDIESVLPKEKKKN